MTIDISPAADETARAVHFTPWRVLEVELSQPLPAVSAVDEATGRRYERALALVRVHTRPLGVVELQLDREGLSAHDYGRQIWAALGPDIAAHLHQDALPAVATLDATGLPSASRPRCLQERDAFLAHAPFVSVIVATHDRPAGLAKCLESLLSLDYPHYEIIVVDNAPSTNAAADLVQHTYGGIARVRYVREDRPGGAWAHNRGLLEVTAPIVAITDDDVVVDPCWLTELVRGFSAAPHVACVTGMIFPRELETPAQLWIEQYGGFSKGFTRRIFDLAAHRLPHPLYPYAAGTFGSGANMAFRTEVLRAIGAFDPALGAGNIARGGDDLAAFFAVLSRGHALVYEPAAIVYHGHHRDYAALRKQVYGYGIGLTAYLTKSLVDRPDLLLDVMRRIPYGLRYMLSPRSPKNRSKRANYPRELTALELKGMLYGPLAYLRGRRQAQEARRLLSAWNNPAPLAAARGGAES